jgi:hypothetical protein
MARLSRVRITHELTRGDAATTSHEKGRALEDLVQYLLERVPGVTFHERDVTDHFGIQETDLIFRNDFRRSPLPFSDFRLVIECKNSDAPVSAQQVQYFAYRLRTRACNVGILVAAYGLTGSPGSHAYFEITQALADGRQILVITRSDIEALVTTNDLVAILEQRLMDLVTYRTYRG